MKFLMRKMENFTVFLYSLEAEEDLRESERPVGRPDKLFILCPTKEKARQNS